MPPSRIASSTTLQVAKALRDLPWWVRSIVTHPDTLNELAPYRGLDTRLVVENMDDRKTTGRTADELAPVFDELPRAGFCLDVAHIHSIDPTMAAGHELLDRFRSRLRAGALELTYRRPPRAAHRGGRGALFRRP